MEWILDDAWPHLHRQAPEARLTSAEAHAERIQHTKAPPKDLRFACIVPHFAAVYAEDRVVICTIRSGEGIRITLIEAAFNMIGAESLGFETGKAADCRSSPWFF